MDDVLVESQWKDGKPVGPVKLTRTEDGVKVTMLTESGIGGKATAIFEFPDGSQADVKFEDMKTGTGPATITRPDGTEYQGIWKKGLFNENGDQICDYDKELQELTCESPSSSEAAEDQDSEEPPASKSESAP